MPMAHVSMTYNCIKSRTLLRGKHLAGAEVPALVPVRLTPDILSETTASSLEMTMTEGAGAGAQIIRCDGQIRVKPLVALVADGRQGLSLRGPHQSS